MEDIQWRTSSFSDGLQCVEVADAGNAVLVRDSNDQDGPVLRFARDEMRAFVQRAKAGEFDRLT